ncbi:MAG TPA: TIGR02680 family protein [Actinomycetes bacterium]|jgi:uncharacterized protein (TIGR02680 family)
MAAALTHPYRFRLSRAGVLNVWQYDEQIFEFADGRLLLRGSNGAGKSKTLEMLLPFVLDGDKQRITASGRHHTSLLWLMLDGYPGQNRVGYLWVEFTRTDESGATETVTCGVGVRASQSARAAASWYFTYPGRIGTDLELEDSAGPLVREQLRAAVEPAGQVFDSPRVYKQHVGRLLFGLEQTQYDELLRLLYWLRQPQVGEDIEPAKLAEQLAQALPPLDDDAVRAAGDTFDELTAFGEQLDRQRRCADAVATLAGVYADYARGVLRARGAAVLAEHKELAARAREVQTLHTSVVTLERQRDTAGQQRGDLERAKGLDEGRLRELERDPALRNQRELVNRRQRARDLAGAATVAEQVAAAARARAEQAGARMRADATRLRTDLGGHVATAHRLSGEIARLQVPAPLPVPTVLIDLTLDTADHATALIGGLDQHTEASREARPAVGELLAAVQVVDDARGELVRAGAARGQAEREAAAAEQRAEEERGRQADAARQADRRSRDYGAALDAWRADSRAVPFELTAELSADTVPTIAGLARTGAEPVLASLRDEQAAAAAARIAAEAELRELRRRRDEVAAQRDPAPAEPALGRHPRDDADGAPLWRLVDFTPSLAEPSRAGLEAALESSGLLDAWVRTDGAVLDRNGLDVVLPRGPAVGEPSLTTVLTADPPADCPVTTPVVREVLNRIGWTAPSAPATTIAGSAMVGDDGSWRLGPLTGRATKPAAQFIGATARAAERARRLAELDELIALATEQQQQAIEAERAARDSRSMLETWLAEEPPHRELLAAWTRLDERTEAAQRAQRRSAEAEQVAVAARSIEATRRRELMELAAIHGLPVEADKLAARREQLRGLDTALDRHGVAAGPLRGRLERWREDVTSWVAALEEAERTFAAAAEQRERAVIAQAEADTLEESVGASIREIEQRIAETSDRIEGQRRQLTALDRRIAELLSDCGAAKQKWIDAGERLAEREPLLAVAIHTLATIPDTPGLLASGAGPGDPAAPGADPPGADPAGADHGAFELARGFQAGHRPPAAVLELARRLAALPASAREVTETAVYAAWQDAVSGPAADSEPRVDSVGGALTVIGRAESGDHPVGELSKRLAAAALRDAELLTERERALFEEHILGDLGESLRTRRQEAEELVAGMNQLLAGVTTSQGIEVRLSWKLREDTSLDTRRAVELLGQPVGALLPGERHDLRNALHRLIEASRADAPEDSYAEHLARALDYRRWFAFRIRYTRPENAGTWHDLHRRSPLSQGEQKVVCYLPLFAAAAAHFSSLAGAAPHSPRFVLLDDAFPKIDVRTHPLLFGLLVQLDLDFVVTSERLWGDHATVPSLAIYEALRDPNERGIAQYRHTWDGHRLQAVGQ